MLQTGSLCGSVTHNTLLHSYKEHGAAMKTEREKASSTMSVDTLSPHHPANKGQARKGGGGGKRSSQLTAGDLEDIVNHLVESRQGSSVRDSPQSTVPSSSTPPTPATGQSDKIPTVTVKNTMTMNHDGRGGVQVLFSNDGWQGSD